VKSKKSHAQKPKAASNIEFDYDGHIVKANIWFKLGLSKTESSMLKTVASEIFTKERRSAAAARALLQAALAHFDILKPLIYADARYKQDEGFRLMDDYLEGVIARQHAKLSGRKAAS
jgi:hypothetical protein